MKKIRFILPLLFLLLAVWGSWEVWRSYHNPVVNRFTVALDGVTSPVRLAVLSDLHDMTYGEANSQLTDLVAGAAPDLILLDGDMLNGYSDGSGRVCALVEELSAVAPVYYAWGNHELMYLEAGISALRAELEAAGAVVLEKEYVDLTVGETHVRLGGLYEYAFALDAKNSCDPDRMDPAVYGFLTEFQDTDACKILLSHRPDSFIFGAASVTWDVDLVISGHNHGGQVVLPFLGGLYGGDQGFFPQYIHGIYKKDTITLAITSGLGTQLERLPRFRNPPEVMILELCAQADSPATGGT